MRPSSDLREFLELLNSRGVDYVIVGAHSFAFHARPRYTGDLDILVRTTSENAQKLTQLLHGFGFSPSHFEAADFTEPDQVVQIGRAPNRIDLLTGITGVTPDEAFASRVEAILDGIGLHS